MFNRVGDCYLLPTRAATGMKIFNKPSAVTTIFLLLVESLISYVDT